MRRARWRLALTRVLGGLLVLLGAGPAGAIAIGAVAFERGFGTGDQGWFFEAGLGGGDISTANVKAIRVESATGSGVLDLVATSGNEFSQTALFQSQADLLAAFPDGNYDISITLTDDSVVTGQLGYAPQQAPNGGDEILAPLDGQQAVPLDVTFQLSNQCTNCMAYNQGIAFSPLMVSVTLRDLDRGLSWQDSIAQGTTAYQFPFLLEPMTLYQFQTAISSSEYSTPTFDGATTNYFQMSTQVRTVTFTPEPSPLLLVGGGLALLALGRRRMRVPATRFPNALG